uniref:Fibronectin type-III domain-containing protein n=1 Tax=Mesocestoides corti TaxID=53468 RepID=A0A5K3FEF8_MESCO
MNLTLSTCQIDKLQCQLKKLKPSFTYTVFLVACFTEEEQMVCSEKSDAQVSSTRPQPPFKVSVEGTSTQSVNIRVRPRSSAGNVARYVAKIEGLEDKTCVAPAEYPYICNIRGLSVATQYTAVVYSHLGEPFSALSSREGTNGSGWTLPEAPKDLTLLPLSTSTVTVTVIPPDDTTGIDRYEVVVKYISEYKNCTIEVSEGSLECKFDGLTAGTNYTFEAMSYLENFVHSAAYLASVWTKPNEPASVTVEPDTSSSVQVVVQPPTEAQGIVSYKASIEGGDGVDQVCEMKDVNKPSCVISGLEPATQYTVRVVSCVDPTNPVVCGEGTTGSGWTRPNKPESVKVESDSTTSVAVTFKAPAVSTGIGRYEVYRDGDESKPACSIASDAQLKCQLTGLEAATEYGVKVRACISDVDPAVCSEDVMQSGWTKPNKPGSAKVNPSSTSSVTVTFEAPADAKGIGRYEAFVDKDLSKSCKTSSLDALSCEIEGLEAGTQYEISATGCIADTDPAVCSEAVAGSGWTKPSQPESVKAEPESTTSVAVTFKAPAVSTGIGLYKVYQDGDDSTPKCSFKPEDELKCSVTGLEAATEYRVKVRACISDVNPAVCSEDVMQSGWTKPNAPKEAGVGTISARSIYVSWSKLEDGYKNVRLFEALARKMVREGTPTDEPKCSVKATAETLGCSIDNLSPGTQYTILTRSCINANLCGDEVLVASITTLQESPNYVLIISLVVVFFVLIIVIILSVVFVKRRKSRSYDVDDDQSDSTSDLETVIDIRE